MKKTLAFSMTLILCFIMAIPAFAYNTSSAGQHNTISSGNHCAAVNKDGSLWTWGWNCYGQLGDGTKADRATPIKVMKDVVSVSVGMFHTAAIKGDGTLWVWGRNIEGQLGNGTFTNETSPIQVMDDVIAVSCGYDYTTVIKTDGSLWAWGGNSYGQLGTQVNDSSCIPVKVMENVVAVCASISKETAALTSDGSLWHWGGYNGTIAPTKVMDSVADFGLSGTLVILKKNGTLWEGHPSNSIDRVYGLNNITKISVGGSFQAVVSADGSLYMWGSNSSGCIGDRATSYYYKPIKMLENVVDVSASGNCTIAVKEDGSIWTWGSNDYGQLGNNGYFNDIFDLGSSTLNGKHYMAYLTIPTEMGNINQDLSPDSVVPETPDITFTDVAEDSWYATPVAWAVKKSITNGTSATTFSPNTTCSTAEIITFLWRASGSPEPTIQNPYCYVPDGTYYTKAAIWAYEMGLVSGSAFNGNIACTRAATLTYFWKQAGSPNPTTQRTFTDVPADAEYAKAVVWGVESGITNGTSSTTFSPHATCTRSQIVTFLYRWKVEPIAPDIGSGESYKAARIAEEWANLYATTTPLFIKKILVSDYLFTEAEAESAIKNARIDWNVYAQIYATTFIWEREDMGLSYTDDDIRSYLKAVYCFTDSHVDYALAYIDADYEDLPRAFEPISDFEHFPAKEGSPNDIAAKKAIEILESDPTLTYYGLYDKLYGLFTQTQSDYAIHLGGIDWEAYVAAQMKDEFSFNQISNSYTIADVEEFLGKYGYFYLDATTMFNLLKTGTGASSSNGQGSVVDSGSGNMGSGVTIPSEAETTGELVWVSTNGGTKYHCDSSCSNMIDPIRVSRETAIANGYTACGRCY